MIGVFSLVERVLLASIQYRQGPVTAMLHGFTQLIADGLKIYSKFALDVLAWSSGIFLLGLTFTIYVGLAMLFFSSALLPALTCDVDLLLFVCLSGLLGCLCVLPMVLVSNRYTSIGCLRQLRALILADIGLDTALVLLLLMFVTLDSGANSLTLVTSCVVYLILCLPIFILMLIASARAPFDLPEAESELVAGTLTDVGGTAFSLCLLVDYLEILAWCTLLMILILSLSLSTGAVLILILLSYLGRLLLCRILLTDVPRLLFLVLLWWLGLVLNVLCTPFC